MELAAIVGFGVWYMKRTQSGSDDRTRESAEDVLRRGVATRDIDSEEFEPGLSVLRSSRWRSLRRRDRPRSKLLSAEEETMTAEECAAMGERMAATMGEMMGGGMMGGGMMGGGMMGGSGWGALISFGILLGIVVIGVVLVIALARRPSGPAAEDPRDILRRRFARGEMDSDQFVAGMKILG